MAPRVAILYTADEGLARGEARDALAVRGVREAAEAALRACRDQGWEAALVAAPAGPGPFVEAALAAKPDVVLNLVESLAGEARLEAAAAWLLEMTGLPYTGSPPLALSLGLEKPLVKDLLRARGVPVPEGCVLEDAAAPMPRLPYPCIVKPAREDASHGIAAESVVADEAAARARAARLIETYGQPAIVEAYVEGREFNVSVLGEGAGAEVLPLGEIDFSGFPSGRPRIVSYEAKWVEDSPEYRGTASIAAKPLEAPLRARIEAVALAAYRAVGLRDYGRVDLRVCPERGPFVLEVNPNPDLSPGAGLSRAAGRAGMTHGDLVARILRAALARAR